MIKSIKLKTDGCGVRVSKPSNDLIVLVIPVIETFHIFDFCFICLIGSVGRDYSDGVPVLVYL